MQKFLIYNPTRLFFGEEHQAEFVKATKQYGQKALIVTGGKSMERLGYLQETIQAFEKEGITLKHFPGIEPNPQSATINRATQEARAFGAEFILALGGGSVMDASKAIAALYKTEDDDIWEYVLGEPKMRTMTSALPVVTIPTTAATASEVTAYAVISNSAVKGKSVLGYEFLKPVVSWMNPAYTFSLGKTTTQDGAADILSHVFENYILGGNDSPIADRYSEMVMLTVLENLPILIQEPSNRQARAEIFWASDLALNGYQLAGRNPSQFVLHAIEHAASGFYPDLAHGRGLATLFPAYFRWLWQKDRARERFARLGKQLFNLQEDNTESLGLAFIDHFENWLQENGLLQSFKALGFEEKDYRPIAEYAVKVYGDGEKLQALGDMTVGDIVEVMQETAHQDRLIATAS